jgi:deoxyribose-phosphate aldolase
MDEALAGRIDHTILKPEATAEDVRRVTAEAIEFRFAAVCVSPCYVAQVAEALRGTGVRSCTVSSFPAGTSRATVKAIESTIAVKDGADEVDMVAHLPYLARLDFESAKAEMVEVVKACRAARPATVIKVIVESAYLLSLGDDSGERAIAVACRAVRESGADFIKTSTGFHPAGGASIRAVELMRKYGEGIQIKASGGIRDLPMARAMLAAGADRLGLSASVAIVQAAEHA